MWHLHFDAPCDGAVVPGQSVSSGVSARQSRPKVGSLPSPRDSLAIHWLPASPPRSKLYLFPFHLDSDTRSKNLAPELQRQQQQLSRL